VDAASRFRPVLEEYGIVPNYTKSVIKMGGKYFSSHLLKTDSPAPLHYSLEPRCFQTR